MFCGNLERMGVVCGEVLVHRSRKKAKEGLLTLKDCIICLRCFWVLNKPLVGLDFSNEPID